MYVKKIFDIHVFFCLVGFLGGGVHVSKIAYILDVLNPQMIANGEEERTQPGQVLNI